MKTVLLDDVMSEEELYFIYKEVVNCPSWCVNSTSENTDYMSNKNYPGGPVFEVIKKSDVITNYPMYLWGQTLVYRIAELLKTKKIGVNKKIKRMWFISTPTGSPQHFLHRDGDQNCQSILLFITPIWKTGWRGSFFVDGEEFKFKPGSAVIYDSQEYHTGEDPISQTYNWQRITLNIVVSDI